MKYQEGISMEVISIADLYKNYGRLKVLKGMELRVEEGEIFGLIGENGMGKTTTIKILLGLEIKKSGTCKMLGYDCRPDNIELRQNIGFVIETIFNPEYLTIREGIDFHKIWYPRWDDDYAQRLLKKFDLLADAQIANLSRGQKARLKLLLAFAHHPKILLIDEVTAGLDARARYELNNILREIIQEGGSTIFMATNLLYDIEKIATRIGLLENGQIAFTGKISELLERFVKVTVRNFDAIALIENEADILEKQFDQDGVHIFLTREKQELLQKDENFMKFAPVFSAVNLEQAFVFNANLMKRR
jgi:ABC-2 type transport system ATP-binding protein